MGEKRVVKMLKLCRQYLTWIQNSVFEGNITPAKLEELIARAEDIMEKDYDSLIIFKSRNKKWLEKKVVGVDRNDTDVFL